MDLKSCINIPLTKDYDDIKNIILIPSLTLSNKILIELRHHSFQIKTGKILADCFKPFWVGKDKNSCHSAIISQFMGFTGIDYILNLIIKKNKFFNVYFFGSACLVSSKVSSFDLEVGYVPSSFYTESEANKIKKVYQDSSDSINDKIILSTSFPLSESLEKSLTLHQDYGINLIDMECAFLKSTTSLNKIKYFPFLYLSDVWDLNRGEHKYLPSPFKSKKITSSILEDIIKII